ncbi:MAG: XdhC/CoxI family protein [Chloroflexi bacterium]|nr:XdhC/CoxI family protein [Chloroflexota bacterium]MBU1751675.1 XdhC/CoxI family protein [Chloroflexota bacterium]
MAGVSKPPVREETLPALLAAIQEALAQGEPVALCTVVRAEGSTPRGPGAKMVVRADGSTLGTVGGGAVEAGVTQQAMEALRHGITSLADYTLRDEGDPGICGGQVAVFIDVLAPAPTLLILGAGHVGQMLAQMGRLQGYRVVVCDDRAEYANPETIPAADRILVGPLPDMLDDVPITPNTHAIIVTRGHQDDEAALAYLLDKGAGYLGMIGSRRKVQTVFDHLHAAGATDEQLALVHAPIGLRIGAQTPAEIALCILAEILLVRRAGDPTRPNLDAQPLSHTRNASP